MASTNMYRVMTVFFVVCLASLPVTIGVHAYEHEIVRATNGMVVSHSMIASEVGSEIMLAGGNAVDAAIATAFALAVTHPAAGNLGGGGFMVIHLANGKVVTNDHREKAPATAGRDMYLDANGNVIDNLSTLSHLASGVPGSVAGLLEVLASYGTMKREKVIAPAIELAENGFRLDYNLAHSFGTYLEVFRAHAATLSKFTRSDGTEYQPGDVWKQPDLAKTLRRISRHGRDGFYKGKTADLLVKEMRAGNGLITHEDLAAYRSVWREPIHGTYKGHDIYSMGPPSSGGVLIVQMLNMLEPYDLKTAGFGAASTVHRIIEAERRAFADRAEHLGDADYYSVPVSKLISKQYASDRFLDFDAKHSSRSSEIGHGQWANESTQTTHLSTMDKEGNAVSYTTTLNLSYGSKIVATGAGFLLNNEMDDFSIKPNTPNSFGLIGRDANAIEPGKRMLSSMSPTIVVKNSKPILVTGSPGGSKIITTVLQVILNVLEHGMGLGAAVSAPRFHHQWIPDEVLYERHGLSPDTLGILKVKGHVEMTPVDELGWANSIMRVGNELHGKSDPRTNGAAVGY